MHQIEQSGFRWVILITLILFWQKIGATTLDSLPTITLNATVLFQKIAPQQIGYLEDTEEGINPAHLNHQLFIPLAHRNLFEITENAFNYWAVLKLENTTKEAQMWWIDVSGNYVDAWSDGESGLQKIARTGNLLKQKEKTIPGYFRNFNYIPIAIKANERLTVKLKVRTNAFFPIYRNEINIGQPIYFENFQHQRLSKDSFLDGVYSAIMLMFCLYSFGYFILTKESFALWAACYGLTLIGYFYQFNSTWYRLGFSPVFIQYFGTSLMNFALLFNFCLIRRYLSLKELFPTWDKIYLRLIYCMIGFIPIHLLVYYFSQNYLIYLILILIVHSLCYIPQIIIGIKGLQNKRHHNIIFSLGLLISCLLLLFNNSQLANINNDLLKLAVSLYILAIFISFSFRAARTQKQKIKVEAERIADNLKLQALQKLDHLKSNFFTNVSHELRTPLTLILGPISSVLKNDKLSNRDFTLLKKAQQNGADLLKLVTSILDLSKLEAGKMKVEEKPEFLFPLIHRIISIFESHADQQQIKLVLNYLAEKDLDLEVDKEKLAIILNNLIANALKFTPKQGLVTVKVEDVANAIKISITDTGKGIHSADLPYVFDRFYQSSQPRNTNSGGTGIGLSLCKEYIELMGGSIEVDSELDKGSTFILHLPRKEVFGRLPNVLEAAHLESIVVKRVSNDVNVNTKRASILLVEDNSSVRDYVTTILHPYFEISTADNGQAAIQLLNTDREGASVPDLILSDVMMPYMDGFQFVEKLKEEVACKHIPVIMLTAKADMKNKLKALRIGVDDYLLKPFDEEELLVRIKNLLKNAEERGRNQIKESQVVAAPLISQEITLWLEEVEILVQKNIDNLQFSVLTMANDLAMSERSLQRQLKKATGLTPNQYIQEIRLSEARSMLEQKQYRTIGKVANSVGFSDTKTFSRRFKQRFGKLPSSYISKD